VRHSVCGLRSFSETHTGTKTITRCGTLWIPSQETPSMFSPRVKCTFLIPALLLLAGSQFAGAQAVNFGTVAMGQTSVAQSVTLTFTGAGSVASQLASTSGAQKQDFAVASGGTCNTGQSYLVGGTCTVSVTFAPLFAGLRSGAVVLEDAGGNVLASTFISGVGSGPQAGFHPLGGATSFPFLGITADKGIAVDGNGNLFVASHNTTTASDSVVEVPVGCTEASCVKQLPGTFGGVWGLAIDGAGNIWVGDVGASGSVTEILASGGYIATKTITGSFGDQIGIAVDGSGNVFFTGSGAGSAFSVTELLAAGGYTTVKILASGFNSLGGVAVDASGNVFFASTTDRVVKEILAVGGSIPTSPTINTIGSGLIAVQDVVVEGSGDLLVSTAPNNNGAVTKFFVSSGYATSTLLSNGFNAPTGIAVTGGGDLYVIDFASAGGSSLFELSRAAAPAITFRTPTAPGETDTADGPQTVLLENIGNQPLAISGLVFSSGSFSLDSGTTTCSPTGSLAPGDSCVLGIQFVPVTTGSPITGTLSVTDNALNVAGSTQKLTLSASGLFTPLLGVASSSNVVAVTQTLTFTINVHGGAGNPVPTGTVQVAAIGYTSAPVVLVNGSAAISIPPGSLSPGTAGLAITYIPDTASSSVFTSATGQDNVLVTSTILNVPTITVTPAANAVSQGQALSVTIVVGQANGAPLPTGTVTLAAANYVSPASALVGGTVVITIPANTLVIGTDGLRATYTPDAASATIYVPATGTGFVAVGAAATSSGAAPADFGSINIGTTTAVKAITLTFPADSTPATLIATTQGATGKDFAISPGGTCGAGINVAAGQSCTVNVTFTPAFAGLRNGAVLALDSNGQPLALTYIHGSGTGPQIIFQTDAYYAYEGIQTPGYPFSTSALSDGFSHPNVAVDGAGNIFVADLGTGSIKEIPAGCTSSTCTVTVLQAFFGPSALAVDGAGNIFVAEIGNSNVEKIPPGCKSYTCMQLIGSGFNQPYGLTVDSSGNVFVADTFNNAIKEVVADGGYTTIKTLATGLDLPWSVVVNAAGDLFVAEGGDQCTVFIPGDCSTINTSLLQIPAAGGYQTVKTLSAGGFGKPFGLAIDGGGNVYEADYGDSCSNEFIAASGYASIVRLCTQSLVQFPEGMAIDGPGNLYLDDVIRGTISKMDYIDPSSMTFRTATLQDVPDVQDGPQVIAIQNHGTAPMTFGSIVLSDSSFTLDNLTTCSTSTPLAAGSSCYLAVDFQPTKTGPLNATLTLTDNNLNQNAVTQVIQILAVALPPTPVILTTPANPTTAATAVFTFSDTQTPITFVCSIDSLPFSTCSSPTNYTGLSGGPHNFQIKAKDSAGNLSNAATYNWAVNSIGPPPPVITSAPKYLTNDDTATFAFTDSQAGVSFQCSLDGGTFAPCTSGVSYSGLAGFPNNFEIRTKRHTFAVQAIDSSNNVSPQTTRAWTDISIFLSAYPVDFGPVPVGQTSATQSVTFQIVANPTVGKAGTIATIDALTLGVTGLDFAVSNPGTCAVGTALTNGSSCTLQVTFTPKYPGQRKGAVILLDSAGNGLGEAYLQGTGTAPQVTFSPYSTTPYTVLAPQNNADPGESLYAPMSSAAIDGAGNVYITDELIASVDQSVSVSSGDIWKFPVGCTDATCNKLIATSRTGTATLPTASVLPTDVTIDGAGILWVSDGFLSPTLLPTVGTYFPGQCTDIGGISSFYSTSVDGAGDGALVGAGLLQSCYVNLGVGQTTQTTSFDFSGNTPSVTVDPQNNLFVADTGNNAIKEVLASSGYTISRTVGSGFNAPNSVASDAYGNIYVSDTGNNAIKEIVAASGYTQVITLASFVSPRNISVDALGNVFVANVNVALGTDGSGTNSPLIKLDFSDTPALNFPTQTKIGTTDTTDGTLTATVKNTGNQPLTITGLALSNTNFSLDAGATTCSVSAPLAINASCTLGVLFTPNGNGALTGTITLTDNALNVSGSTQTFALSGTAFTTPTTSTPTVTVNPASTNITTAQSDTVTVTVTGKAGSPTPTGVISLIGGNYTSATLTLSGGTDTFTIPAGALAVGSTTLNAIYTPDTASSTTYGVGAGSASITVVAIVATTPTVTVTPALSNINSQQTLAVTITVSDGGSRPTPTGTVTLSGGNFASQATTLNNGTTTITIPAGYLPAGADTFTAFYTPDHISQPNYNSASGTSQVSVEAAQKLTPAVTVTPATSTIPTTQSLQVTLHVAGGSGKPTPTGSIVLSSGSFTSPALALAQGGVAFTIPAGALANGSDTLTATFTPDTASNLTFNNASGTAAITVATPQVATTTTLQASASSVVSGTNVNFTVTVAPASGTAIPTGQVVLTDGSSTLTTLTLNASGTTSYSTTALSVRSHVIIATYQGDSANIPSTSSSVTVVVTAPTVQVTVGTTPTGLSFSVDGTTYTSSQVLTWTVGSSHTLASTSPQTSGTTQNTFASWSDAGALSHSVTAPSSATSFTATFNTAYQLTTATSPSTGGTVSPASGTFYPAGAVVNLTATPNSGFAFASWTGTVASTTSASTTITMSAPQSVTANFTALTPAVTLTPPTLTFTTITGTTSAAQVAMLTNTGTAPLTISGITLTGTGASTFAQTNTCGSTLAPTANCTITITFTPSSVASFAATLTVADSAAGSPHFVTLSGTGSAAPSFTLSSTSPTQTVSPGGTASFVISVAPVNGSYSNPIALAASGLPTGAVATFTPPQVTPGNTPASSTLTIQIPHATARLAPWGVTMPTLAFVGLLMLPGRRRRLGALALLLFTSLGALTAITGCGGGFASPTSPATTFNITVTGTSGAVQQTTTVNLTVQ
jgi:large repetitive protein